MHSTDCPECGEDMEEVIGFPGYVWCRDCHITKQVEEGVEENSPTPCKEFGKITQ